MDKPVLVVLAAGMGSRYGGMKQLDPVGPGGQIIIDYSIYDARRAGFEKVIFIIRKENEADFRQVIGDRLSHLMEVEYAYQSLDDLPAPYTAPEGRTKPFGTGQLAWSQSGYSHFADVRGLFLLDFWVLGISAAACLLLLILRLGKQWVYKPLLGHGPGFWAGVTAGGLVLILAGLAALDFNRAFVIFHAIFFPGKDNWIFDSATDQIILVMPEEFFCNCAILIGVVLLTCCTVLILTDLLRRKK